MKTMTVEDRIANVADRWKAQYFGSQWMSVRMMDVWSKLKALPENATAAQVAAIVGNDTWTSIRCYECGQHVEVVIVLNETEDYNTFAICEGCLNAAQILLHSL